VPHIHSLAQIFLRLTLNTVYEDEYSCRAFPASTLARSSDFTLSRSAAEHITGAHVAPSRGQAVRDSPSRPLCGLASKLLLTQKAKLPCLSTVYSGKPDTMLEFFLTIVMI